LRHVGAEPLGEQDVGLERDADDLLVTGRRDIEARELGLGSADRGRLAAKSTKTAEAVAPTGGVAAPAK